MWSLCKYEVLYVLMQMVTWYEILYMSAHCVLDGGVYVIRQHTVMYL